MSITEENLKKRFAKNLSSYRRQSGMTQLELAERLNYSDKSVSKWERGDGLPDLFVAATIADMLGVSLNDLISEREPKRILHRRNKLIITGLSIGLVWLIASILFFIFQLALPTFAAWMFFAYAVPASAVVCIVFTCIWWKKIYRFLSVSALIWSLASCVMISFPIPRMSLIFMLAAVLQILSVLWFLLKKRY